MILMQPLTRLAYNGELLISKVPLMAVGNLSGLEAPFLEIQKTLQLPQHLLVQYHHQALQLGLILQKSPHSTQMPRNLSLTPTQRVSNHLQQLHGLNLQLRKDHSITLPFHR
uniref:Uncharacterized protein n=1 Tax=Brassica oleracea TaxID=3712 RepID=A0A3P6FSN1_BRAOL|nr:unnamed protein product [Brassica oleracea]